MERSAIFRARILSALRTIEEAKRCQVRARLPEAIPLSADETSAGFVDVVEIWEGHTRVAGWTNGRSLQISTERQTLAASPQLDRADVPAEHSARGFDIGILGTDRLVVSVDGVQAVDLDLRTWHDGFWAWLRTIRLLLMVPIRLGGDLWRYASRGDVAAGNRLEAFLVSPHQDETIIIAAEGLLETSESALPDGPDVDIILPVFNAYEDVKECLDRLGRHTETRHRIILIDDASTDARIAPQLESFAAGRDNTLLITAKKNTGFIGSVNRGLAESTRDVVLLNSDAFVPDGWLDRLMEPLRTDPAIASATPMTNDGEIASVPLICRAANLQAGWADGIDRTARKLNSAAATVAAPTGVGFCMALSRRWLDKVPEFDTAFGAGYGEEVDWCQKTQSRGGKHKLVGKLFVEHRGGSSFGTGKMARIAEGNRRIAKRYPYYDGAVQDFIRSDPAIGQRLALGLVHAGLHGRVPVYLGHRMGGGAEYWLSEEVERHTKQGMPAVVVRDGDAAETALLELHHAAGVSQGNVPLGELADYLALLPEKHVTYSCLVASRDPIQLLEAVGTAMAADDTLRIVFHDYFPICPSHNLLGHDGRYCGLPDEATCSACYARLACQTEKRPETIGAWREIWRTWIEQADDLVVFSTSSRSIVTGCWPEVEDKVTVEPHDITHAPPRSKSPGNGPPVVGVLGGIGFPKGAGVLRDLAQQGNGTPSIVVVGQMDPAYAHPAIHVHGPYDRSEIGDLVEKYKIDRWFLPSICPETFSFTTHECLATGLPVFVFDLGAQADAVRHRPDCRVVALDTSTARLAEILSAD